MTHVTPAPAVAGAAELPESYPTFWDAIPVDLPAPAPKKVPPAPADRGPVTLWVEQSDVGID